MLGLVQVVQIRQRYEHTTLMWKTSHLSKKKEEDCQQETTGIFSHLCHRNELLEQH